MAAPIGPGDWVECIRSGGYPQLCPEGSVHLVEDVGECSGIPSLILRGIAHPTLGFRWVRADHFRPIYRPRADLIETLLAPVDPVAPEPVPA